MSEKRVIDMTQAVKVRLSWSRVNGSLVVEAEAGPKDGVLTTGEYILVPADSDGSSVGRLADDGRD